MTQQGNGIPIEARHVWSILRVHSQGDAGLLTAGAQAYFPE